MEGVQLSGGDAAVASLIRWWRDAGVDTLVDDAPRDWLARTAPLSAGERGAALSDVGRGAAPQGTSPLPARFAAAPLPIEERVELPNTLDALLAWMRDSADAPEARWGRTRLLPAGNPQADIAILIDAPEQGDVAAGSLLSGELGELFDKMLLAIGLDRASVWLMPFATIRPIGRIPQDALRRLTDIARHQIALVGAKRLLVMGDTPSRALLGAEIGSARGQLHPLNLGGRTVETVATFLPRLLNEKRNLKAQAWKDLQLLKSGL